MGSAWIVAYPDLTPQRLDHAQKLRYSVMTEFSFGFQGWRWSIPAFGAEPEQGGVGVSRLSALSSKPE